MRILVALHNLNFGGSPTFALTLARDLQRRGHDLLFASGGGPQVKAAAQIGEHHELAVLNRFDSLPFACSGLRLNREWKRMLLKPPPTIRSAMLHEYLDVRMALAIVRRRLWSTSPAPPTFSEGLRFTPGLALGYCALRRLMKQQKVNAVIASQATPIGLTFAASRWNPAIRRLASIRSHTLWQEVFPPLGLHCLMRSDDHIVTGTQEIADHLKRMAHVAPARMHVCPFAVDTDFFRPKKDTSDLREALGIPSDCPIIVQVSSLASNKAGMAHKAIEAIRQLWRRQRMTRLVIVGGGDGYAAVKQRGEALNAEAGQALVILAGAQSYQLPEYLNLADVTLAVGRCARESMACERPVVVDGPDGYAGLVTAESVEAISATNYTGRGFSPNDTLATDLERLLDNTELRHQVGQFGRRHIMDHDSVARAGDLFEELLCAHS